MPSPFPGMDPYLEDPELWQGFHACLMVSMQRLLNRTIRPAYFARLEQRVYVEHDVEPNIGKSRRLPDIQVRAKRDTDRATAAATIAADPFIMVEVDEYEIKERFLEIRSVKSREIVTVIELLSPSNKARGGEGRSQFRNKRAEILESEVHWLEIDLLRLGARFLPSLRLSKSDYSVCLSRIEDRPDWAVWSFTIREPLPKIAIPLRSPDGDAIIDLQEAFTTTYDDSAYDEIDYTRDPHSPLTPPDATWARKRLKAAGLRK